MVRWLVDRIAIPVVVAAVRLFYRHVDLDGRANLPRDRPVLLVANHFNGLVDPLLIVYGLRRLPRFLAKATLWRPVLLRPVLKLAGMIPVYRPEDRQGQSNTSTFAAAHEALARNQLVALFPEGTTHDNLALARLRTGAARIALGARAAGVIGLMVVPVGLTYFNKFSTRSDALIQVGEPIDLDTLVPALVAPGESEDEDNHQAVRSLTDLIERRLEVVTPRYDSVRDHSVYSAAAHVAERGLLPRPGGHVDIGDRERVAQRIADAPAPARDAVERALGRYSLDLGFLSVDDDYIEPRWPLSKLLRRSVIGFGGLLVFAILPLVGLFANLVPYWLVRLLGEGVRVPVTKGTVRFIAAAVIFPLSWLVAVWVAPPYGEFWADVLLFLLLPVLGFVFVWAIEQAVDSWQAWVAWRRLQEYAYTLDGVRRNRDTVVLAVEEAIGQPVVEAVRRPDDTAGRTPL